MIDSASTDAAGNAGSVRLCQSLDGEAQHADLWELGSYCLDSLQKDLATAISDWNWQRGCFGHSLPLTSGMLSDYGKSHYNNLVMDEGCGRRIAAEERLEQCHFFRAIFDALKCQKSSFRILRRPGLSSYTLHADRDVGANTIRMQIPVRSGSRARLLVTNVSDRKQFTMPEEDYSRIEDWTEKGMTHERMQSWYRKFIELNQDRVRLYELSPGRLYHFDSRNYHNLLNGDAEVRYTLSLDLVVNEWLQQRYPALFIK